VATIRPFRALRPPTEKAKSVASVPYDVINSEEARELAAGNPLSFLHVSRPEIDLPPGTDLYSDAVYRKAVENFESLIQNCPLELDTEPSLYLYRLVMGNHEQIGIVGCCSVDEYDDNTIRKHERTRRDKEDDRTRHMLMLRAQTGLVFLTYRQRDDIDQQVSAAVTAEPIYDVTADDGIRHTLWQLKETAGLVQSFRKVPLLYIADGHHRVASASRARADLKANSFAHTGKEDYNFFLTVLFPDSQLQILAYNRVVKDLNGLSQQEFLNAISRQFTVTENANPEPENRGHWSMYLDGKWYELQLSPDATLPVGNVALLDVSILQDRLLDPILGIQDIRTDKRIDFVGGLRGTKELERLVDEGKAAVAFSLYPTTVKDLLMVSDAGEIMPPKSTWFEPKLRDGLVIHKI
jgi:uncharacterized protein (DUF1015 family)